MMVQTEIKSKLEKLKRRHTDEEPLEKVKSCWLVPGQNDTQATIQRLTDLKNVMGNAG